MTGLALAADIRYGTKTTSVTLTDVNLLPLVNNAKDEIATLITEKIDNYFIIPGTFNLVASQREYALPEDLLNNIVSVELAFAVASPLAYIPAFSTSYQQFLREFGALTEANIIVGYDNSHPAYFLQRRSIWVLSGTIIAVTNGGRLRYRAFPADLANLTGASDLSVDPTTTSFGIPKIFHQLWSERVQIYWKVRRPKPMPLTQYELGWEQRMRLRLSELTKTI